MQIGDTVKYSYSEFDGYGTVIGEIAQIENDHIIMTADGINYWFDNSDIGDMTNDSMDIQVIPKDYVDELEQRKKSAEEMLTRKDLSPADTAKYKREVSACETEGKTYKEYLRKQGKYRELGVDSSIYPSYMANSGRKRR